MAKDPNSKWNNIADELGMSVSATRAVARAALNNMRVELRRRGITDEDVYAYFRAKDRITVHTMTVAALVYDTDGWQDDSVPTDLDV